MSKVTRLDGGRLVRAKQFGLDFARFGGHESVIYQRLGNAVFDQWIGSHVEPDAVVAKAFGMQRGCGWGDRETWYVPDSDGMGQGVMSLFYKKRVLEFHAQARSTDSQFANRTTEAWFNVQRKARAGQLWLPKDDVLIGQLSTRRYAVRKKDGKLIVFDKHEHVQEGHDSPDRADAFVEAYYDQMVISGRVSGPTQSEVVGRHVHDPYLRHMRPPR